MVRLQALRYCVNNLCVIQHADLDGIRENIVKHTVNLFANQFSGNRLHTEYTSGILCTHDSDNGHAIHAEGFKGFQVGLNTCAACRVGACNAENGFHVNFPPILCRQRRE